MRRFVRNFFGVIFAAVIFFDFANCSAEDLRFIDAKGDVGYYVDASTIQMVTDSIFFVDLAIIRASVNQMDVINLKIDYWAQTYSIQSVRTLSYDERTELKSDNTPRATASYAKNSLIGDVARFVIEGSL